MGNLCGYYVWGFVVVSIWGFRIGILVGVSGCGYRAGFCVGFLCVVFNWGFQMGILYEVLSGDFKWGFWEGIMYGAFKLRNLNKVSKCGLRSLCLRILFGDLKGFLKGINGNFN